MRPLNVSMQNFGSFRTLNFDFIGRGLTLVQGPSMSGKSTTLDALCWTLYGRTSKDSGADDMKSWFADGATIGQAAVEISPGVVVFVYRARGARPSQNDLYFYVERDGQHGSADPTRGANAVKTQEMLDEVLGCDAETFIIGSYIHQFSKADQFFIAKAKDRREVIEKIADMSLAVRLGEASSENRKGLKKQLQDVQTNLARLGGQVDQLKRSREESAARVARWENLHAMNLSHAREKVANYESEKAEQVDALVMKLEVLDKDIVEAEVYSKREANLKSQLAKLPSIKAELKDARLQLRTAELAHERAKSELRQATQVSGGTCPMCLGPCDNPNRIEQVELRTKAFDDAKAPVKAAEAEVMRLETALAIEDKLNKDLTKLNAEKSANARLVDQFEMIREKAVALRDAENPHKLALAALEAETNPYKDQSADFDEKIAEVNKDVAKAVALSERLERKHNGLDQLYQLSLDLRGALMSQAVREINDKTNSYLERFWDADLRVRFTLKDSDKLDVEILNGGYHCPWGQLSGGERCMLKMAFSLSLMQQVEDTAGVTFSLLMLDETFNGVDSDLRTKAYPMLQTLEGKYETILVIDHDPRFKNMFDTTITVARRGDYSELMDASSGNDGQGTEPTEGIDTAPVRSVGAA